MAIEKSDYDNLLAKKRDEATKQMSHAKAIELLRAETVEATKLTGDPRWDQYLSRIQPLLTTAQKLVEQSKNTLPMLVDDGEIRKAQIIHAFNQGRAQAFAEAIAMPSEIISYYEKNKDNA